MSAIEVVFNQPWVGRAGWTLLHFLWQGALIAFLFAAVRGLASRSLSARARYAQACAALGIMTIAPLLTFLATGNTGEGAVIAAGWQPSGALEPALPWVVAAWLCGTTIFFLRLIGAWRFTKVLRSVGAGPAPQEWQEKLDDLIARIGVSRPVRLLVSSIAEVPMVVGWLKPVVLMPVGALAGFPLDQVEALMAHELAHIWRSDYLVNILQSIAEAVLFYHPAVWWVSEQIRIERELCCDDVAVAASGDVLVYARALTDLETRRRARLNVALAADGGSLVSRVRRLIAEPQPVVENLPAAGAAWVLSLMWLAAIGAVTVHGAPGPVKAAITPPALRAPAAPPFVNALLFDPFFDPPQSPAPQPAPPPSGPARNLVDLFDRELEGNTQARDPVPTPLPNQYGHVFSRQAAYLVESDQSACEPLRGGFLGDGACIPNRPNRQLATVSLLNPVPSAVFEAWVEDATSSDYIENATAGSSDIEREPGKTTIHRYVRDDLRPVSVEYTVTIESLPQPGTYRVSFPDPRGRAPMTFPVPQVLLEGDALRVDLYLDPSTGQRLVDYIQVGPINKIRLRKEAPHDLYGDAAELNLSRPQMKMNGLTQEVAAVPEALRGRVLWVYIPGSGRYVFSFKRYADLGFNGVGEVNGNSLTFTEGRNIFRIESADRIAAGSGAYRVHVLRDSSWVPADPNELNLVAIGAVPGVEPAVPLFAH